MRFDHTGLAIKIVRAVSTKTKAYKDYEQGSATRIL